MIKAYVINGQESNHCNNENLISIKIMLFSKTQNTHIRKIPLIPDYFSEAYEPSQLPWKGHIAVPHGIGKNFILCRGTCRKWLGSFNADLGIRWYCWTMLLSTLDKGIYAALFFNLFSFSSVTICQIRYIGNP